MKMQSSLAIERPTEEVFAVISDFSRNPEWQDGMKSAVWTTEPPIAVGSTYDQVARFLGRDIITSFEVVAYEPGRSISIESRQSTFPIHITRSVEPLDGGRCVVTADVAGEPGGILGLLSPIMDRLAARSVRGDYARLKALLEDTGASG